MPLSSASPSFEKRGRTPFAYAALGAIRAYQLIVAPLLTGSGCCRFVPSCSDYAMQSIHHHGALKGSWLALKRVLRCHPFGGHGLDPVP